MSGQVALYVRLVIVIDHCVVDALDIMDFGPCAMYEYVCVLITAANILDIKFLVFTFLLVFKLSNDYIAVWYQAVPSTLLVMSALVSLCQLLL